MKLPDFIRSHMESIVAEWEGFARTLTPGAESMDKLALRDHAKAMLLVIADDIETYQSERMRGVKSRGEVSPTVQATAATIHGGLRFTSQFSMVQLAAEFRALRATVLRLWIDGGEDASESRDALIRFNEGVDQALAESIDAFMSRSNTTRDLFMGVLGHDLRAPLATISSAAETMLHPNATPTQAVELAGKVKRASRHMAGMIDNLIGYTRLQLGNSAPMQRAATDAAAVCRDAILDANATFTGGRIELVLHGDLVGNFDAVALRQLMTNLFVNALQHGVPGGQVHVQLSGRADDVALSVANDGPPIPTEMIATIFQPMVRAAVGDSVLRRTSSGLGLFVAREVAIAHGGTIAVASSPDGRTRFDVVIPKSGGAQRGAP